MVCKSVSHVHIYDPVAGSGPVDVFRSTCRQPDWILEGIKINFKFKDLLTYASLDAFLVQGLAQIISKTESLSTWG